MCPPFIWCRAAGFKPYLLLKWKWLWNMYLRSKDFIVKWSDSLKWHRLHSQRPYLKPIRYEVLYRRSSSRPTDGFNQSPITWVHRPQAQCWALRLCLPGLTSWPITVHKNYFLFGLLQSLLFTSTTDPLEMWKQKNFLTSLYTIWSPRKSRGKILSSDIPDYYRSPLHLRQLRCCEVCAIWSMLGERRWLSNRHASGNFIGSGRLWPNAWAVVTYV